jgi:anti-anti-sigma factor
MSNDYFQISQNGSTRVVALRIPPSVDSRDFDMLNDELLLALDVQPGGAWIIDVSGVTYMGSSALGLMVNIRQRVLKSRGKLVLCGLSPQLLRIFHTCCMERLFHITKNQAEALEAIME